MKLYRNIVVTFAVTMLISACADFKTLEENEKPVIDTTLDATSILHDSAKIGKVNFKLLDNLTGSYYLWSIKDNSGRELLGNSDNNVREMSYDFTKAGSYTVSVQMDNTFSEGIITIPAEQSYEIDLGAGHTIISNIGEKTLYVYGDNNNGQLCIDKKENPLVKIPSLLTAYKNTTSVAAGNNHTLFADNKNVYSCGANTFGQLGNGSSAESSKINHIPFSEKGINKVYVSAGGDMSVVGVNFMDGKNAKISLYSFGYDETAQNKKQNKPKQIVSTNSHATPLITTGNNFTILRATSSYNVFSLGINDKWQLGRIFGAGTGYDAEKVDPDFHLTENKTDMASGYVFTPYGEEKLEGDFSPRSYYQNNYFAKIAAGDDFTVSIKKETTEDSSWTKQDKYGLYVWGNNDNGQLGFINQEKSTTVRRPTALFNAIEDTAMTSDPNKVKPIFKEMVEVAAGRSTGYAISKDGTLYTWGDNSKGQFTSNSKPNNINQLVYEVSNPKGVKGGYKKVWAGGDRVIALAGDNNLYTWGDNTNGILGIENNNEFVNTPEKLFFSLEPAK